jgi:hypothetical protein
MSSRHSIASLGGVLASALSLSSCALVSRGDTLKVRYFTLDAAASSAQTAPVTGTQPGEPRELRLGRVDATRGLGQEIAVRTGEHEVSYREGERWTDRPAQYVRRGLERALFQTLGFTRAYVGDAPTLDVELVDLAILDTANSDLRVRVQLVSQLHDARRGLCDETTSLERAVARDSAHADPVSARSIAALAGLLEQLITRVAQRALQCLAAHTQPTRSDELTATGEASP